MYKMRFIETKVFIALLVFISPLLLSFPSQAQLSERDIEPLRVESGARPLALGGSFVSIADDSNTALFNPAGLARSKGVTLTLANNGGIVAAHAYPTGFGWTVGLGVVNSQINNMPYAGGTTNYNSNVLVLSFGSRLSIFEGLPPGDIWHNIDFGLSYKDVLDMNLRQTGEKVRSADGFDMDAGILMKVNDWLKMGVVAKNFLGESASASEGGVLEWDNGTIEAFPTSLKLGIGMKLIGDVKSPIYMEDNELLISSDLDFPLRDNRPMLLYLGAEWLYQGRWAVRAGLDQRMKGEEVESSFTYGVGLRTLPWGFDVAYHEGLFEGDSSIYFSILYWPEEWVFVRKTKEQIEREKREVEERRKIEEELVEFIGPAEKFVTDEDFIDIEGKVKPGSKVLVNGNSVFVGSDGKVKARVPLDTGKNLIEIVTEYDGIRKTIKRQVLRQPKVVVAEEVVVKKELEKIKPEEEKVKKEEEEIEKISKKPVLKPEEKKELEVRKAKVEAEKKRVKEKKEEIEKKQKVIVEKKEKLKNLATLGIIDIEPEKEYKLEERITRGELAIWLVRAKTLPLLRIEEDPFKDVPCVTETEGIEILKRFNELR